MDKKRAVKSAMASMEMEGFVYTEEEKSVFDKLGKGEITGGDIREMVAKKVAKLKIDRPECFTNEVK